MEIYRGRRAERSSRGLVAKLCLAAYAMLVVALAVLGLDRGFAASYLTSVEALGWRSPHLLASLAAFILVNLTVAAFKGQGEEKSVDAFLKFLGAAIAGGIATYIIDTSKAYVPVVTPLALAGVLWLLLPYYASWLYLSSYVKDTFTLALGSFVCGVTLSALTAYFAVKMHDPTTFLFRKARRKVRRLLNQRKQAPKKRRSMLEKILRKHPPPQIPPIIFEDDHHPAPDSSPDFSPTQSKPPAQPSEPTSPEASTGAAATTASGANAASVDSSRRRLLDDLKELRVFEGVVGLEDVKREIVWRFLLPMFFPEEAEGLKPSGGILLYGPPGTGKTELLRSLLKACEKLGIQVLELRPSNIYVKWVGDTERRIADAFNKARCRPSIIFMDEVEGLLARRMDLETSNCFVYLAEFLQQMDGLKENEKILVIACTNKPWVLDEAVLRPGRLGTHFYIPPPTKRERAELFKLFLKGKKVEGDVDFEELAELTKPSEVGYYSGADIKEICERALVIALQSGRKAIRMEDLEMAVEAVRPSIATAIVRTYESFIKAYPPANASSLMKELEEDKRNLKGDGPSYIK